MCKGWRYRTQQLGCIFLSGPPAGLPYHELNRLQKPSPGHPAKHLRGCKLPSHPQLCSGAWALTTQHPPKPRAAGKGHQPFCYSTRLQLLDLPLCPWTANGETFAAETLLKPQAAVTAYVANTEDTKREKGGEKSQPSLYQGKRPCEICR